MATVPSFMAMMPSFTFVRTCRGDECESTFGAWCYSPFVPTLCTGCRQLDPEGGDT